MEAVKRKDGCFAWGVFFFSDPLPGFELRHYQFCQFYKRDAVFEK
jgi:hypothetical protein